MDTGDNDVHTEKYQDDFHVWCSYVMAMLWQCLRFFSGGFSALSGGVSTSVADHNL